MDHSEVVPMKLSYPLRHAVSAAALVLALGAVAHAQGMADDPDVPIATGEHWMNAADNGKIAYLLGIANVLDVEQAIQGDTPPADDASLVPVMMRGLNGMSLRQVSEALDRWYADNPNQLGRPVLETIWFEIAKPNS
jgi:hypothetical protein